MTYTVEIIDNEGKSWIKENYNLDKFNKEFSEFYRNNIYPIHENYKGLGIISKIHNTWNEFLSKVFIDVDFAGVQICQLQLKDISDLTWIVTNAMNGWGENNFENFTNAIVKLTEEK